MFGVWCGMCGFNLRFTSREVQQGANSKALPGHWPEYPRRRVLELGGMVKKISTNQRGLCPRDQSEELGLAWCLCFWPHEVLRSVSLPFFWLTSVFFWMSEGHEVVATDGADCVLENLRRNAAAHAAKLRTLGAHLALKHAKRS